MVLAAASVLMEEFTEEGLQVVDLVESLLLSYCYCKHNKANVC